MSNAFLAGCHRSARIATVAALAVCSIWAQAESYPAQRIELVVPYPPGGGTDAIARTAAESISKIFPQPVVVINKPGASGSIGLADVANGKADGYKLAMMTPEVTYLPSLNIGKVSNDNFVALAQFTQDPASVTVRADAPWKTIEEFLAHAKKEPESIRIANSGHGAMWHLAATALEEKAKVKFLHVPYQGSAPAFMALLSGQVEATTVAPGEMATHIAAGKLKVLAVMSPKRITGFEGVPTLVERGVDLNVSVFRGIAAPKDTPEPVVKALREALKKASEDPALRARIAGQSMNFSYADGPEFAASMQKSAALFRPIVSRMKLN